MVPRRQPPPPEDSSVPELVVDEDDEGSYDEDEDEDYEDHYFDSGATASRGFGGSCSCARCLRNFSSKEDGRDRVVEIANLLLESEGGEDEVVEDRHMDAANTLWSMAESNQVEG